MGIFRDHAAKYFERGLPVMPVWGKKAISPGWQFAENLHYEDLVEDYPRCNIGLLLGKDSGLVALDWDKPISDYKQFYGILEQLGLATNGPKKIGRKGVTIFYKWSAELVNTSAKGWYDFLVDRRQTVLPPSIHPDIGEPYRWDGPSILEFVENGIDFPTITLKHLAAIDDLIESTGEYSDKNKTTGRPMDHNANDSHRNDTLYKMACAAFGKNKSVELVASELLEYDSSNYKTHPDGPWFQDIKENHARNTTPNERALKFAKNTLRNLLRNKKLEGYTGTWEEDQQALEDAVLNIVNKDDPIIEEIEGEDVESYLPPRFLQLVKYIGHGNTTVHGAILSTLALSSSILGQRICYYNSYYERKTMPNIYTFHINASGGGKSNLSTKFIRLKKALADLLTGLENFGGTKSSSALFPVLKHTPSNLVVYDEFHQVLVAMRNPTSPLASFGELASEVYSCSNSALRARPAVLKEYSTESIEYPFLSMHACTQPHNFIRKVLIGDPRKPEEFGDVFRQGFAARFIIAYDEETLESKDILRVKSEDETFNDLRSIIGYCGNMAQTRGNYLKIEKEPGVDGLIKKLYSENRIMRLSEIETYDQDSIYAPMISRITENTIKVALIFSAFNSIDRKKLIMTHSDVESSEKLVKFYFHGIKQFVGDQQDKYNPKPMGVLEDRVLQKLVLNKENGLTRRELLNSCKVKASDIDPAIKSLTSKRIIKIVHKKGKSGPPAIKYFLNA